MALTGMVCGSQSEFVTFQVSTCPLEGAREAMARDCKNVALTLVKDEASRAGKELLVVSNNTFPAFVPASLVAAVPRPAISAAESVTAPVRPATLVTGNCKLVKSEPSTAGKTPVLVSCTILFAVVPTSTEIVPKDEIVPPSKPVPA